MVSGQCSDWIIAHYSLQPDWLWLEYGRRGRWKGKTRNPEGEVGEWEGRNHLTKATHVSAGNKITTCIFVVVDHTSPVMCGTRVRREGRELGKPMLASITIVHVHIDIHPL